MPMHESEAPRGTRPSPKTERLAKALRENLKRRKAQSRDRAAAPREPEAESSSPGEETTT